MSFLKKMMALFALVVMQVSVALASGYQLNEHGAKAVAMEQFFVVIQTMCDNRDRRKTGVAVFFYSRIMLF